MGIWLARFVRMLGSYSFYARLHRDRNRAKRFALTASCESIGLRRAHAVCHYMRMAMPAPASMRAQRGAMLYSIRLLKRVARHIKPDAST
ncbi:hypothetical protein [Xanthomonas vasicola]|uniref:hypothetical protein n=1 Tax=Xanthomonas vasicola TaxID=56459 RepID=UPI00209FC0DE|nr:hypothetical protein [Xanthomonas vasicola]MDO6935847.1 hypothetical protein [Xanthomonas vasicola]MDO6939748.1 hypothetical protein [Xanthomonas vasicola]